VDISRQPGCLLKNNPFFGLIDIRLCHNRWRKRCGVQRRSL